MPRRVDLESWSRRDHHRFFRGYARPFFTVSVPVDVTHQWSASRRQGGPSFTLATVWLALRALNQVPELRLRMRGDQVVEHERVHGGITVLRTDETFGFAYMDYGDDFSAFARLGASEIEAARVATGLAEHEGRDDLAYFTILPWLSFTSFEHAWPAEPDCIPRLAFGRVHGEEGSWQMPVALSAHHALADGLHAGRFFETFQGGLDEPALLEARPR